MASYSPFPDLLFFGSSSSAFRESVAPSRRVLRALEMFCFFTFFFGWRYFMPWNY